MKLKSLAYFFVFVMVALLLFALYINAYYATNNPHLPDLASGRIYPLNAHGGVVYLTSKEDRINFWSFHGGLIATLLANLCWWFAKRKEKNSYKLPE